MKLKGKLMGLFLAINFVAAIIFPTLAQAYEVKGDAAEPKVTITKYEQEGKDSGKEVKAIPLAGVTYELTMTHKYNEEKDSWEEFKGDKKLSGTTNDKGEVVLTKTEGLELGRYEVKEVSAPDHVIRDERTYTIDVPMTNEAGTELNYDVKLFPKNEIIRGDATLTKVGEDGKVLVGVEFDLYNSKDEKIKTLTTNEEGQIKVTGLAQGTYYFVESKTLEGLVLNNERIMFEVEKGKQNTVSWKAIDGFVDEKGQVTNYKVPTIKKDVEDVKEYEVDRSKEYVYNLTIGVPKDITKYKTLGVTDTLDDRLTYAGTWSVKGTEKENIDFKQEGQTLVWSVKDFSNLTPNSDIVITFASTIKPDAKLAPDETGIPNTASLTFDNKKGGFSDPTTPPTTPPVTVTPKEGGIKVVKVDKSDKSVKLAGAEFKLTTDKEGKNVVDAKGTIINVNDAAHDGVLANLVTNAKGEIKITGLTPGVYYLHETKAPTYKAEDGEVKSYRLLTKPVEVTVVDKVMDKEVTVENSKSGWHLPTTGGMGTILFTASGLGLMLVAMVMVTRRKKETN